MKSRAETQNNNECSSPSPEQVSALQSEVKILSNENIALKKQIDWFKDQFKLASQRHFGKSSENTSSLNLVLFDEDMSSIEDQETTHSNAEPTVVSLQKKKKSKGRQFDFSKFPKEQIIYDLDEDKKVCDCGDTLKLAGEDSSIQVDHIPETFKVIEHITLKYCCRQCDLIISAKKSVTGIPKCMATAGLIAEVMIRKYEQHLPLYRQTKIFAKLGADIHNNTLGNWVMRGAEVLEPLKLALIEQIANTHTLQADETKIKTLKPSKEGYFWAYHSCDPGNRFILFEYAGSRGGHVPSERLKTFSGILQTDGYSGYSQLRKRPDIISVGCWDHCRRKFTDVIKVADRSKTGKAAQLLLLINRLYEIERESREMDFQARKMHRQAYAKPILDSIHDQAININAPPKSLLGIAVTYLLNQWMLLIEYIQHGEVPISNCWVENQIRPFAVGRRNWLFTGTPESANKAALIYSLIQNCNMHGVNARKYLEYVLDQAHAMRRNCKLATSLLPQFIDKLILL
jgi:transposase